VADTGASGGRLAAEEFGEVGDASGPFAEVEVGTGEGSEAGAVIAAVFQAAQSFQENRLGLSIAGVTYDATHALRYLPTVPGFIGCRSRRSRKVSRLVGRFSQR
jgi:hypothetical protein